MKIIETSEEYKKRIGEEGKEGRCPECGSSSGFGSYYRESKLFGLKYRKKHKKRCMECHCSFEYYGDWERSI